MSLLSSIPSRIFGGLGQVFPLFIDQVQVVRYIPIAESAGGFSVPDSAAPLPVSDRHITGVAAPGVLGDISPVVFFRTAYTGTPRFSVRLNATHLVQHTVTATSPRAWHQIVPAGVLRAADNELVFAVSGDGSVRFEDVVILYTATELTVRKRLPGPVVSPG